MNIAFIGHSALLTLAIFAASTGFAISADNISKGDTKQLKAQVLKGLDMAAYAKLSVSERYLSDGKWPNNNDEAKVASVIDTDFTIKVGNNGIVTITYHDPVELAGKTIAITPSVVDKSTISWECKGVDVSTEYLPKKCQ